jgi:hypothetical protein
LLRRLAPRLQCRLLRCRFLRRFLALDKHSISFCPAATLRGFFEVVDGTGLSQTAHMERLENLSLIQPAMAQQPFGAAIAPSLALATK